jgi:hypothetical protein
MEQDMVQIWERELKNTKSQRRQNISAISAVNILSEEKLLESGNALHAERLLLEELGLYSNSIWKI